MIRISGNKIKDIVEGVDGQVIEGIKYESTGPIKGISATFNHDNPDEELAKATLKKYIKTAYPVLRVYVEIV